MLEYELPSSVILNDTVFAIRRDGDFRMVLDCFRLLQDEELSDIERIFACLMTFYADISSLEELDKLGDIEEAVKQMFLFFNCNQENVGAKAEGKVIDWDKDALMIISAVNKVAGKEIRAEKYLHWWTFLSYYMAIGECTLATVVNIRRKLMKNEKLEKYEQKFVKDSPELFNRRDNYTKDEKDFIDEIRANWSSGGKKDG